MAQFHEPEFSADGTMKWQRVTPPIWWPGAELFVIADRHLPDGTRQHMVEGTAPEGLMIDNAHVIGALDVPGAEFSSKPSHLSEQAS